MVVLTWIMAAAGYLLERRAAGPGERPFAGAAVGALGAALPCFAAADVVIWQLVAAGSQRPACSWRLGNALLLGLLAMLWLDRPLAYGTLASG